MPINYSIELVNYYATPKHFVNYYYRYFRIKRFTEIVPGFPSDKSRDIRSNDLVYIQQI